MKLYEVSSSIQATPEAIWAILVDVANYANWDSGVERVEGRVALGGTLKLFSSVNPGRAFPLKVTELEPGRLMRWGGGMPLGLFKGVRTYTLAPDAGGATKFTMREEFSGLMLPLIWRSMPDLQSSFEQFASGLKAKAEGR